MKWKDKRDISLLSTIRNAEMTEFKRRNETKRFPIVVNNYNNFIGGTDRVEQYLTSYLIIKIEKITLLKYLGTFWTV